MFRLITILLLAGGLWPLSLRAADDAAPALRQPVTVWLAPSQPEPPGTAHFAITARDRGWLTGEADAAGLAELERASYRYRLDGAMPIGRSSYLTYDEIQAQVQAWADAYPAICRRYSIGRSHMGRELWVLRITDTPDIAEGEPEVRITGAIHGNEPVTADFTLRLIRDLLQNYQTDSFIKALVDNVDLHLLPLMNPDGYSQFPQTRENAAGKDLNRSFPSVIDPVNTTAGREPEVAAVMNWTAAHRFALAASLHAGALGVVYPWGHQHNYRSPLEQNPETPLYQFLSLTYAASHATMWGLNDADWTHGTINGSQWYAINGEMPDWSYRWYGCAEITVELNENKAPLYPGFAANWDLWLQHRGSLFDFIARAADGAQGRVTDRAGLPVKARYAVGRRLPVTGETGMAASCLIRLAPGWNLLALPVNPSGDPSPEAVFPQKIGPCWTWTGQTYTTMDTVIPGMAFWLYYAGAAPLTATVSGTLPPEGTTALAPGWNMVGPPGYGTRPDNQNTLAVYSWNSMENYEAVPAGTRLDPLRGYWFYNVAAQTLSLTENRNRPLAAFADAAGEYARVLEPGSYGMWFADTATPGLAHTVPAGVPAGTVQELTVTAMVPAEPLQFFGVNVPAETEATGLPASVRQDIVLNQPASDVLAHWSGDGGSTWQQTAMTADAAVPRLWRANIPTMSDQSELRYYFELRNAAGFLAGWQTREDPAILTLGAAGRSLVGDSSMTPAATGFVTGATELWSGSILGQ